MLKAQVLSGDYILSITVFLTSVVFFIYFTSQYTEITHVEQAKTYLLNKANEIRDSILYYPGTPSHWNSSYVIKYGFSDKRNVLNITKLTYLKNISYEDFKNAYNLNEEVFINISYVNGTNYLLYGLIPSNPSIVVKSKGYSLIEKKVVSVEVQVWN